MKKTAFIIAIILILGTICAFTVACDRTNGDKTTYRLTAPEGTPALAVARLICDNAKIDNHNIDYNVVAPSNIASEMASKKSDVVIMPLNAGANLIRQGADYKLVGVAVNGSLFMVGKGETEKTLTFDDIKGKKIACIGQTGVPGLVFRYVMSKNGIQMITDGTPNENQVLVKYVADGPAAKTLLADNLVDFAVVGEPAATQFKIAIGCNMEMDLQAEYAKCDIDNGNTYPQAGIFVKTAIAKDNSFMTALFEKLAENKEWVTANPSDVQPSFVASGKYQSAVFPAKAIPRCAISGTQLDENMQNNIIKFLENLMPKDANGNQIDWQGARSRLF